MQGGIGVAFEKYEELRKAYPRFIYEAFSYEEKETSYEVTSFYTLEGTKESLSVRHVYSIDKNKGTLEAAKNAAGESRDRLLLNAAFHVGLVECINYWKAVCSPELIIKPFCLPPEALAFWEKLFYKGLGEFLYRNDLYHKVEKESLVKIHCDEKAPPLPGTEELQVEGSLIPVGGGKDSVVTLELLKAFSSENHVYLLDPRKASVDTALCAGFGDKKQLIAHRRFDPVLFDMNKRGFLNGHVPYSAILGFCAVLGAMLLGKKNIVLSNEGSANEPTVPNTDVNHQYSKTLDFESDFHHYVIDYITPSVRYFSLLRPWSEVRITMEFARHYQYHALFRSCNRGSRENKWCGHCPKCLFVFILLGAQLGIPKTSEIFGGNLLEYEDLVQTLDELTGLSSVKPFECVGTVAESVYSMDKLSQDYPESESPPPLVAHYRLVRQKLTPPPMLLVDFESGNLVPLEFRSLLTGE